MPLNSAGVNLAAAGVAAGVTHLGLASGDPGAAGTANATTAARQAAGWAAPVDGDIITGAKTFTGGAANGAVQYVTYWSAATGGTFLGSDQIPASGNDLTFNAAGEYVLTFARLNF